jgi:hypothetical protein
MIEEHNETCQCNDCLYPFLSLLNKTDNPDFLDLWTAILKSMSRMSDREQLETTMKMLGASVGVEEENKRR